MKVAQATHGVGGLKYDASKRARPPELNVFVALLLIVAVFEILGRLVIGDSFLFNTRENVAGLFNQQRLEVIILQVSIVGIIAIGVTQVIITGGILGVIAMRLVIGQLLVLVNRYPPLVDGAFVIIAWVAIKLFVEYLHAAHYIALDRNDDYAFIARSEHCDVTVELDWGSIVVSIRPRATGRPVRLSFIVGALDPSILFLPRYPWGPDDASGEIDRQASLLANFCADILAGDFSKWASLEAHQQQTLEQWRRESERLVKEARGAHQTVRGEVAKVLKIDADAVHNDRPLSELGLDSLSSFELKSMIEDELALQMSVSRESRR